MLGSLLATGVGALMVAQSSGGAVGMACIPFVSWSEGSLREAMSEAPEEVTRRLRLLAHLVNGAALAQLGTAMLQFILNDPLSGLIGGGIAAIGCQTAHPAGFRLLPTYVVLSFCHGIMQVLLNLQLFASGVPLHAMTSVRAGLMGKLAVGTLVASPLVMFLGMGMGYCLHKEFQQVLHASTPVPAAPAPLPATPAPAPGNDAPGSTSRPLPAEERAAPKAAPKAVPKAPMLLSMPPAKSAALPPHPKPPGPWHFPGTGQKLGPDSKAPPPKSPPSTATEVEAQSSQVDH